MVNLKPVHEWAPDLTEYLSYVLDIKEIVTNGIYTNIFYGNRVFIENLKSITRLLE